MDMVGVIAALAVEGTVFRRAWGLKSLDAEGPFRCYGDEEKILIVSGTGKVRCASAVSWLVTRFPALREGVLINAGIAGSKTHQIGTVHLIQTAADTASGKRFYPDILFAHPYGEAALHTVDRPSAALLEGMGAADLVDMEGAAFLEAAQLFLPCHRSHIVKVVSDNLSPEKVDRGDIPRLMENVLPAVAHIIESVPRGGEEGELAKRMAVFSRIGERWRLTASQRAQLKRAGRAWLLRHPDGDFSLPDIAAPRDKQSRNRALADIIDRLWER